MKTLSIKSSANLSYFSDCNRYLEMVLELSEEKYKLSLRPSGDGEEAIAVFTQRVDPCPLVEFREAGVGIIRSEMYVAVISNAPAIFHILRESDDYSIDGYSALFAQLTEVLKNVD